jgi:hypothetical protein
LTERDYQTRLFLLKGVIDRRTIAKRLGVSYQTLCGRLNGFTQWKGREEMEFVRMLMDAEQTAARGREVTGQ